jgi:cell division initiation protein
MELSPLEIKSQKFSKKLKGYDVTEVENFLEFVSKDLEKLYGEFYNLKEELVKKNQEIKEYKEKDKLISEAILMVKSLGDEIKDTAKSEARSIINNAIAEAKKIINNSYTKYSEINMNINELLNKRMLLIDSIKGLLSTHIHIIEQEESKKIGISLLPKDKMTINSLADALKNIDYENNPEKIKESHEDIANREQSEPNHEQAEKLQPDPDGPATGSSPQSPSPIELEKLLGDVNKFNF